MTSFDIYTVKKSDSVLVLKIKPCKRNNRQNSDHTKDAVQTGQRWGAPRRRLRNKTVKSSDRNVAAFLHLHWIFPKRINLGSLRMEPSSAVRLQTCPQRKSQAGNTQVPSHERALSTSLRSLLCSYKWFFWSNHQSEKSPWIWWIFWPFCGSFRLHSLYILSSVSLAGIQRK